MSDEKTLFNRNADNNENSEAKDKQLHAIAKEEELDFVDLSSAFDEEDDEDETMDEEYEEEYEEPRSVASFFSGLPFFRRRREFVEDYPIDKEEKEEIKESVQPEDTKEKEEKKEEKNDSLSVEKEQKNDSSPEEKEKEVKNSSSRKKKKKKKSKKNNSPVKEEKEELEAQTDVDAEIDTSNAEVEKETVQEQKTEEEKEIPPDVTQDVESEKGVEEQPIVEETVSEIIEIPEEPEEETEEIIIDLGDSEEISAENDDEEIVLLEGFQEKTEDIVVMVAEDETDDETLTEENAEKKRFSNFAFLRRKQRGLPVQNEEIVAETKDENEIELLPSFEESQQIQENIVEEVAQNQEENPKENKVVEEDIVTEVIEEIPPFESTAEEKTEESFEEIPPFEATIEEKTEEIVESEEQPTIKKKKVKKGKKVEESTGEQGEKAPVEMMTMRDHLTFILIILALLLTIVFIVVKFIPFNNDGTQNVGEVIDVKKNVSEIQLQRESATGHLIQSDIENVFYVYSPEYNLSYYECDNKKMSQIKPSGTVNATVTLGQDNLPVKIDYIQMDGQLFGTGIFSTKTTEGNYVHSMAVFKLVNLPKGYEQKGKALLLATTNEDAVSQSCNVWTDSYVVDLETGKTARFLTSDNNIFSTGYSILTDEGYASLNGKIPFLTTREYDAITNKKDIYLKEGKNETSFATDVAGNFVYVDGNAVCYLKSTENGFNVIRKANGKESTIFSLRGDTSYMYYNEYLLDKYNGIVYNVKTGEKMTVSGYGMVNAEMMAVSEDGRYVVVAGLLNSALDYQVHIFDLKTGNCEKYVDDNFSQHENLAFVDNKTIVYSVVEPKQGYEYVILDVSKALK